MPTDLNLLRHLLPRVDALGSTQVPTLERTATPAEIIDAGHPVARLERAFRSPHLDSVLVHRVADDRMGLVTRSAFFASLSGDLGFGRALLARGVVADVADWQPLVLDGGAGVVEAALALTERSDDRRYDPVVVRSAEWKLAAPADVVRALMALLAVRSLVDEPTGLANRAQVDLHVRDRMGRVAGTAHRVAVLALRLDEDANPQEHDGVTGESLVAAAAAHLRASAPVGWDVGRTGDHDFALVGTVHGPVASAAAAAALDDLQTHLATTLHVGAPHAAATGRLRSAAVCTPPGGGDPQALLRSARRRLGARREERHPVTAPV